MANRAVDDLATLKALANPIRLEALGRLRADGPATATELGRALGESSASLSYHLRQLARFGFVDDDVARDGRERRWRAVEDSTTLPNSLADSAEGRAAMQVVKGVQQRKLLQQIGGVYDDPAGPWEHSDYLLELDADDLQALSRELSEVIARFAGRGGKHRVALHVVAAPQDAP